MPTSTTSIPEVQVRLLQAAVAVLALIPIGDGLAGAALGIGVFGWGPAIGPNIDSAGRYLSGLLLAVGLSFWATVPRITTQGVRFRLLTLIVLTGGFARLYGVYLIGSPSRSVLVGLTMELLVTPALALWRERLDHVCANQRSA
jgi:hypothetical protein